MTKGERGAEQTGEWGKKKKRLEESISAVETSDLDASWTPSSQWSHSGFIQLEGDPRGGRRTAADIIYLNQREAEPQSVPQEDNGGHQEGKKETTELLFLWT